MDQQYHVIVENPPTREQAAAMVAANVDVLAELLRAGEPDEGEQEEAA